MPQDAILEFIATQGLGWFVAIVLLVPVAMLLVLLALLVISKRYLGLDFKALQDNQRAEIDSELQLVIELRQLREKLGDMSEAMWGNRDYTDRQIKNIQQHFDAKHEDVVDLINKALDNQHKIVVFLVRKMGKSEPVRTQKSATEVFLKDRSA